MVGETLRAPQIPQSSEIQPAITIPYKDFLVTNEAAPGTVLINVKPRELFTYQHWTDINKIINVLRYVEEGDPLLYQLKGHLHYHTKFEENVVVVGNGHHRALYAIHAGSRVNVTLVEPPKMVTDENPFRITNLDKKYGNVFGGL
jgi:hypothetical protein